MKPPYRIPSMAQIDALPDSGHRLVSTFSGCGGSCLGFRWAGYRTLWASEFVPIAAETYKLNHPDVPVDSRDIREVSGADILDAIGLGVGELDVLEGSPPCASFSMAGRRSQHWGKVKAYSETKQRTDDLFDEYTRLLREIQPKVFVAENVPGLVRGKAKGYFKRILAALKDEGYAVQAKVLPAEWLGVPQMRHRLIFVGVRSDLGMEPAFPKPLPYQYTVRDACPWLRQVRGGALDSWSDTDRPANTVCAMSGAQRSPNGTFHAYLVESPAEPPVPVEEQTRFPRWLIRDSDCINLVTPTVEQEAWLDNYATGREWDKLAVGGSSERYFNLIRQDPDRPGNTVCQAGGSRGAASVAHPYERRKWSIAELRRICGFPDDFKLPGTYAQQWERLGRAVPPPMMAAVAAAIQDEILCKL